MSRFTRVAPVMIAVVLGGALVGASSADEWERSHAKAASASQDQRADARDQVRLRLKTSPYGRVIFANGFAQYLFSRDGRKSRCYNDCADAWPPLLAEERVVAGKGIDESLLGTRKRRNGTRQVTYGGAPLYGYVHDPRGEVFCHDVREFGGKWYAVLGSGERAPT
jgi:predicted lipoprotein with Yx(FWY)xxD motif